jgi:hypothetical protein
MKIPQRILLIISLLGLVLMSGCNFLLPYWDESDLIGTWFAAEWSSPQSFDTLIIKEDGTYKQIIELERLETYYESDWQSWWVEYDEYGYPYLHLEGWQICASDSRYYDDCNWVNDEETLWPDYCGQRYLQPGENEIILTIFGNPHYDSSMSNRRFTIGFLFNWEAGGWRYLFQEE